jgi:tetratricopeptide (TPR) repeat protein
LIHGVEERLFMAAFFNTTFYAVALLIVSTIATLAAFGGKTWEEGDEPLRQRITKRGWISLICLGLSFTLGIFGAFRSEASERQKAIYMQQAAQVGASRALDQDHSESAPNFMREFFAMNEANKAYDDGHYQEALAKINISISQLENRDYSSDEPGIREKVYLTRARIYVHFQEFQNALRDLDEIGDLSKLDSATQIADHYLKGFSLRALKRYDEAIQEFAECRSSTPECNEGYASSNLFANKNQEAVDAANSGLEKDPDNSQLLEIRKLGLQKLDLEKQQESLDQEKKALDAAREAANQ